VSESHGLAEDVGLRKVLPSGIAMPMRHVAVFVVRPPHRDCWLGFAPTPGIGMKTPFAVGHQSVVANGSAKLLGPPPQGLIYRKDVVHF
jgi:hypothetical protein